MKYDTLKLNTIIGEDKMNAIIEKSAVNIVTEVDGEVRGTRHKVNGITVKFRNAAMTVELSLPKFRYGSNMQTLKHADLGNVLSEVESILDVPILDAYVRRIDIAENIIMEHDCQQYFDELLMKGNYKQQDYKPGVNFFNTEIGLCFYDKIKEADKYRVRVPDEFVGKHLLRYEFRFKKNLAGLLRRHGILDESIRVKHLLDKNVYNHLINLSYSHYLSITKSKEEIPSLMLHNPTDYINFLAYKGIIACGGEEQVRKAVQTKRMAKKFANKSQPYRILEKIDEIMQSGYLCRENPLVKELNMKMAQAMLMSRC